MHAQRSNKRLYCALVKHKNALLKCVLHTQIKGSIVMDDEKEKPTGFVAYFRT